MSICSPSTIALSFSIDLVWTLILMDYIVDPSDNAVPRHCYLGYTHGIA